MKYLFIFLILVCGCAKISQEDKQRMGEAYEITKLFEQDYQARSEIPRYRQGIIRFVFTDLSKEGDRVAGLCWYLHSGRLIQYDRKIWDELDYYERLNLVYHENGHCQLSREHRCSLNEWNIYSIMYPTLHGSNYIKNNLDFLKEELFSKLNKDYNDCTGEE